MNINECWSSYFHVNAFAFFIAPPIAKPYPKPTQLLVSNKVEKQGMSFISQDHA